MRKALGETGKTLRRMLVYTKGNRIAFWVGLILSASDSLVSNALFSAILYVIIDGITTNDQTALGKVAALFGMGFAAFLLIIVLGQWMYRRAGAKAALRFRSEVMDGTLYLPARWYEERHSGDTVSRLTNDVGMAEQILRNQLVMPLKAILAGIGGSIVMFTIEWRMALAALALGLLSMWAATRFVLPVKSISERIQGSLAKVSERLSDIIAAAPLIRVFNLGSWVTGRLVEASDITYGQAMVRVRLQAGQDTIQTLSFWMSFTGLVLVGSIGVVLNFFTLPVLVAVAQMNNGLSFMFQSIGGSLTQLQACGAGADRVFELMDMEKENTEQQPLSAQRNRPAIQLSDVCFSYEGEQEVLRHLTETVMPGEKVALVGSSGSGKSSVLKLLLGFYTAQSGAVRILGQDLSANSAAYRSAVAYVPQTSYLFTGTIRYNILAGKPDATDEEIERAARAALAHDFIIELPQGYDTEVGERGAQLSGGQRQRIAIARAILKNAPILLLDEATASLDSEAERQVQAALERLMEGRTVIVVAHRLSTVRNADRILVMEGGTIVERGTHEELLAQESLYARYVNTQMENIAV